MSAKLYAAVLFVSAAGTASAAPPSDAWVTASPATVGLDPAPLENLPAAIAHGDYPKTTSVLVVKDGKLAYEHYFGEGSPTLLNDTRSATKSLTSLAVGVAIGEGAISSASAPAFSYLSDLAPFQNDTADKKAITVQDMLTMSSALDCNDDDDNSPGNENNMHPQTNWTRWAVDLPTMPKYARDAAELGPWRYCTTNAFLLGQIVQRATHTPVDRYINEKLLTPLGIAKWEWQYSPSHETMTGGGLRLSSRDLAKVAWMVADGGKWHGKQIEPASWIDAALTARRDAYPGLHYGYFFWQHDYNSTCGPISGWYMAGNGGNAIVILRKLHAAVVVTRENYNTHGMHQQTIDLLEKYVLPAFKCAP